MKQPILKTERLILDIFKSTDLNDIFNYASDQEVARTTSWEPHKSIEDSKIYLEWIKSNMSEKEGKISFVWAIREIESNHVIGSIDFKNIFTHSGQFDYALARNYWNKGIATEAGKKVLSWAFDSIPSLVRFQSYCLADNVGSRRVMEKCGLELEGIRRKNIFVKGVLVDTAHYAIIR